MLQRSLTALLCVTLLAAQPERGAAGGLRLLNSAPPPPPLYSACLVAKHSWPLTAAPLVDAGGTYATASEAWNATYYTGAANATLGGLNSLGTVSTSPAFTSRVRPGAGGCGVPNSRRLQQQRRCCHELTPPLRALTGDRARRVVAVCESG